MNKFLDITDCIYCKNQYYMIDDDRKIKIYDRDLNNCQSIKTHIPCDHLTYNEEDDIFYLNQSINSRKLYLSRDFIDFEEIDMPIKHKKINNISYCKCYNSLLITSDTAIYGYNLKTRKKFILYELKESLSKANCCTSPLCCPNNRLTLVGTICCKKDIYIVYQSNKIYYIGKLINGVIKEIVYKTRFPIINACVIKNKIWILVDKITHKKLIDTEIDCECQSHCCNCKPLNGCKCDVIESIACMEKSLAVIINNEGLKIQKAIKESCDIDELLCVNDSVKDVIYYITALEFLLTEKLKSCTKDNCQCQKKKCC